MKTLIISGGDYSPLPDAVFDRVIACDRGYLHARRMGIQPDLIIGDFDSAPVPEGEVPVERFSSRKDDTDTMLAVKKALSMGSGEILIACAFGGRLDHTVANIQSGAFIAGQGGTTRERVMPDTCYTGRNDNIRQGRTTIKCIIPDARNAVWQYNSGEGQATEERPIFDDCNTVRNDDSGQRFTTSERAMPDAYYAVRNCERIQR